MLSYINGGKFINLFIFVKIDLINLLNQTFSRSVPPLLYMQLHTTMERDAIDLGELLTIFQIWRLFKGHSFRWKLNSTCLIMPSHGSKKINSLKSMKQAEFLKNTAFEGKQLQGHSPRSADFWKFIFYKFPRILSWIQRDVTTAA